jgi:hypothetical protein
VTRTGQIVVSEFVSLDGVVEDPAGGQGFRHGGWVGQVGDEGRQQVDQVKLEGRWAPAPCCWAGGRMSSSRRGGHPGVASCRTG